MNLFADLRARIDRSEQERGAILVLTALVMLLLLFIAAFATDLGAWYRQSEEQQRAADVGSLNGIASFDRGVLAYFEDPAVNVDTWQQLTAGQAQIAERQGFEEAVETIQALLETSGLTFSGGPFVPTIATDPLDPNQTSFVVLIADDGTRVTITRLMRATGTRLDGSTIYTRAIEVQIESDGEQFFSNILRDAPTITRAAEAVQSNCGATCENNITLNPPFFGFDAPGNGDGYTPLLLDLDQDGAADEVWAVNHHATGTPVRDPFTGALDPETFGSIICFDADTKGPCDGNADQYDLLYATHTNIMEYVNTDPASPQFGYIYFAGTDQKLDGTEARDKGPNWRALDNDLTDNRTGLVCFDTINRAPCPIPFRGFWDMNARPNFGGWINANAVFGVDKRVYIFAQHGEVACVNLDMSDCGTANAQSLGVNAGDFPIENASGQNSNGRIVNDADGNEQAIWTQYKDNNINFVCVDLSRNDGAVSNCGVDNWGSGANASRSITFERYRSNGDLRGVCAFSVAGSGNTHCVDVNGNPDGSISGLSKTSFGITIANPWIGQAFTWEGERTFFGLGRFNQIVCWDWSSTAGPDGGPCTGGPDGNGSALVADEDFIVNGLGLPVGTGRQAPTAQYPEDSGFQPYAFAQVNTNCLLALGDEAIFFSFDPRTWDPCTETDVTTPISPCLCADETEGVRWGAVEIPQELVNQVTVIEASVSYTDGGAPIPEIGVVTLFDEPNGIDIQLLDLSPLDALTAAETDPVTGRPVFYLTVRVNTRIVAGEPVFTQPVDFDLQILVAPTLTE